MPATFYRRFLGISFYRRPVPSPTTAQTPFKEARVPCNLGSNHDSQPSSLFARVTSTSEQRTMPAHAELARFFHTNRQWAEKVSSVEPDFFQESAKRQTPKVLWFGCADSRVPESVVLAVKPGEVFVHRNIANQFHLHDDSALSVLTFAVQNLGVQHVVVVGHTQCGGVRGAYGLACNHPGPALGESPLGRWLTPLVDLAASEGIPALGEEQGLPKLTVASVTQQVKNIASTNVVKDTWAKGIPLSIHGWVYHLETGKLEDLGIDVEPPKPTESEA